jgi:hypothetical protein
MNHCILCHRYPNGDHQFVTNDRSCDDYVVQTSLLNSLGAVQVLAQCARWKLEG